MDNLINPNFRTLVFKGKNKNIYKSHEKGEFLLAFESSADIAYLRNKISKIIFELLSDCGIMNHFIKEQGPRQQIVRSVEIIPIVCSVYSYVSEDLANKFFAIEGVKLKSYLIQMRLKKSKEVIAGEHLIAFEWMHANFLEKINLTCNKIGDILTGFFKAIGVTLYSVNLEFGKIYKNGKYVDLILADEMSPMNMNFRFDDLLHVSENEIYFELARRLKIIN